MCQSYLKDGLRDAGLFQGMAYLYSIWVEVIWAVSSEKMPSKNVQNTHIQIILPMGKISFFALH